MDARELELQLAKLSGIDKMIMLLEEIAFNTSSRMIERHDYLTRVYACGVQSATTIHGNLRTQSEARIREMSIKGSGVGIQQHANRESTPTRR